MVQQLFCSFLPESFTKQGRRLSNLGDCPQCGKHIGRKDKLRMRMMVHALSDTEKIKGLASIFPEATLFLEKIKDTAGTDLGTLTKLGEKGWCLDCIISYKPDAEIKVRNCSQCGSEINQSQEAQLMKLKNSLTAISEIEKSSKLSSRLFLRQAKKLDEKLDGNKDLVLQLLDEGYCAKCITEKCGKEF